MRPLLAIDQVGEGEPLVLIHGLATPRKIWNVVVPALSRTRRVVTGAGGKVEEPFDTLVLATGSRPFVPPMEGANQEGVFVFRTLEDCDNIASYARHCSRAAVIGGGLLGLEAARGLLSHGVEVTVVEVAPHLMIQQLDPTGAALLKRKMEVMGVRVLLGTTTSRLLGEGKVTGLHFQDGATLDTDMVVISCGIRPNVDEAKAAGLVVDRAIVVDDQLRTSDPSIFAVGECAQHRGKVYGLVDPIYEQARVLAEVLTNIEDRGSRIEPVQAVATTVNGNCQSRNDDIRSSILDLRSSLPTYAGSRLAATLKVMGVD